MSAPETNGAVFPQDLRFKNVNNSSNGNNQGTVGELPGFPGRRSRAEPRGVRGLRGSDSVLAKKQRKASKTTPWPFTGGCPRPPQAPRRAAPRPHSGLPRATLGSPPPPRKPPRSWAWACGPTSRPLSNAGRPHAVCCPVTQSRRNPLWAPHLHRQEDGSVLVTLTA